MLAVVELGGNQFTVKIGEQFDVKKLDKELNETFSIEAMLTSDEEGKDTKIGTPTVKGSKVELKVIDQYKGEKVGVFKMKAKKRYVRNKGFRADLTKLEVLSIA